MGELSRSGWVCELSKRGDLPVCPGRVGLVGRDLPGALVGRATPRVGADWGFGCIL